MVLRAFHPQTLRLQHKISIFGAFSALEKSEKVDGGQGDDEAIARKGQPGSAPAAANISNGWRSLRDRYGFQPVLIFREIYDVDHQPVHLQQLPSPSRRRFLIGGAGIAVATRRSS
jgi:hypothetical protein